MTTTAGERWAVADSRELDDQIVGERRLAAGMRGRSTRRCAMEVRPAKARRFRCRGRAVHGSDYCVKHLEGKR